MHSEKVWKKIKKEYLQGSSMQSLHRKYAVSVAAISLRAKKENWSDLSEQVQKKTEQKVIEKMSDTLSEEIGETEQLYITSVKTAINRIYAGIMGCDPEDPKSLKAYVSALKDIKDMGVINIVEQENKLEVVLEEALNEYAE